MATSTTSKKTLKNFHVRNGLWKLFEVRANEMDCSIDYLINEAMRLYARTHNFASSVKVEAAKSKLQQGLDSTAGPPSTAPPSPAAIRSDMTIPRPAIGTRPVRPSAPPPVTGLTMPRPPTIAAPHSRLPGPSSAPPGSIPPQEITGNTAQRPPLTLIFQGRKLPITSAQFIIGRGSKSSDLAIKDANISRKHAAVIYHNGAYYLKDLGSTNGIEYNGQQVDSKRIGEGDVFSICGYPLHFTYSVV